MSTFDEDFDKLMNAPLKLGTVVKPWGRIAAVQITQGERYYMFAERGVALIPGRDVEKMAQQQHKIGRV